MISENFVLSTVATINKSDDNYGTNLLQYVIIGDSTLGTDNDDALQQRFDVINEFVLILTDVEDPNFVIRLLQLNESIKFNEYIQPACLPSDLHKIKYRLVPNDTCKKELMNIGENIKYIRGIVKGQMLCAAIAKNSSRNLQCKNNC